MPDQVRQHALDEFAATILSSNAVLSAIRREIRRVSEIMVEPEVIDRMLREEVLKRDTIEGEQAEAATRKVTRAAEKTIRRIVSSDTAMPAPTDPQV